MAYRLVCRPAHLDLLFGGSVKRERTYKAVESSGRKLRDHCVSTYSTARRQSAW